MADHMPENLTPEEIDALENAWIILDTQVNRRDSWHL